MSKYENQTKRVYKIVNRVTYTITKFFSIVVLAITISMSKLIGLFYVKSRENIDEAANVYKNEGETEETEETKADEQKYSGFRGGIWPNS